MDVAWYMDSSDTIAIIFRVVSLMRPWYVDSCSARLCVPDLPSVA